ncbi:MAG: macro domain-containing protein [Desulfovibrio sp.]|nr:macro domain-containing protein [Desulfovibrio sp.]
MKGVMIMIIRCGGDIFSADAQALVNPVNCEGVMGKGLAFVFKKRFPRNFGAYRKACLRNELQPGRVFVFDEAGKTIINFPTKTTWRNASSLQLIEKSYPALKMALSERGINAVAIPSLGCGLGGLSPEQVFSSFAAAFAELPVKFYFFEPLHTDKNDC